MFKKTYALTQAPTASTTSLATSATPATDQELMDSVEQFLSLLERQDSLNSADEENTSPAPFSFQKAMDMDYSSLFTNIVSRLSKTMPYGQAVLLVAVFVGKVEKRMGYSAE